MTKRAASVGSLVVIAALARALSACNTSPAREPAKDEGAGTGAAASAALSASVPGASAATPSAAPSSAGARPAAGPGACASDADCRTFSSYCTDAPCACRVLAQGAADPRCAGSSVSCFVDPCMNKTARCQGGACVLTPR